MTRSYTDTELLSLFQQDDEQAVKHLYGLYYRHLCNFAKHILQNNEEAEDVVVESFLKLLKNKREVVSLSQIKSYLYTVTRNACYDLLRHQKYVNREQKNMQHLFTDEDEVVYSEEVIAKVMQAIYEEIETLPQQSKRIFTALFIEGKSTADVATEMGLNRQTVLNQKSRALQLLRTRLYDKGFDDTGLVLLCILLLGIQGKG